MASAIFAKRLEGGHGMAVLDAGKIAAQQARAPLDIALRKASLAPVTADDFPDIDFWFLFWHGLHTFLTRGYLTQRKIAQEVSFFFCETVVRNLCNS
jgi:hypothetical protein